MKTMSSSKGALPNGSILGAALALAVILLLALPPVRALFEAHPSSHMLVQLPLLAFCGAHFLPLIPRWILQTVERHDVGGVTSFVVALFCLIFWMLPRSLDASIDSAGFEVLKFISLPFFLGLPLRHCWQRIAPVLRAFAGAQFIAMLAFLGWLYASAPIRICNNYLEGAQQDLGTHLLLIALGLAISAGIAVMVGGPTSVPLSQSPVAKERACNV